MLICSFFILFCFVLCRFVLFYSILFCLVLFSSLLFSSLFFVMHLFCFVLFCSVPFSFVLYYFILFIFSFFLFLSVLSIFTNARSLQQNVQQKHHSYNSRFGWPKPFDTSYVDRKLLPQGYPDILCNHALFNQKPMKAVMPPDTSFITILRDPLENFPSAFEYMDVAYVNKMKGRTTSQNIDTFFHKINDYFVTYYKKVGTVSYLLRNGQFFDLGHRIQRVRTQNQVYPYIKEFERIFDHVLITEYFDESLILMKREFCWELEDVLYFKFLERTSGETQLSATAEEKIRLWSHADVILYEHFKDRLLQEILKQGQDFYDEVEQLRELNKKMKEKCIGEEQLEKAPGSRSSKVKKFVLRQDLSHESKVECCRMIRSENDYVDYHRTKQGASGKNRLNPLVGCE